MTWAPPEPLYAAFCFMACWYASITASPRVTTAVGTVTRRKNFRRIRRIRLERSDRCLFMKSSYSDRINDRMTKE